MALFYLTHVFSHLLIYFGSPVLFVPICAQRRKWKRAMVPCRRELEHWLMTRPCYTVGCRCEDGLGLTSIHSEPWRADGKLAMVWWRMSTRSVMHVSLRLHWVILNLCSPFSALTWWLWLSNIAHNAAVTYQPLSSVLLKAVTKKSFFFSFFLHSNIDSHVHHWINNFAT